MISNECYKTTGKHLIPSMMGKILNFFIKTAVKIFYMLYLIYIKNPFFFKYFLLSKIIKTIAIHKYMKYYTI